MSKLSRWKIDWQSNKGHSKGVRWMRQCGDLKVEVEHGFYGQIGYTINLKVIQEKGPKVTMEEVIFSQSLCPFKASMRSAKNRATRMLKKCYEKRNANELETKFVW